MSRKFVPKDRAAKPQMDEDEVREAVRYIRTHFNDPDAEEDAWNTESKYYNFKSGNWTIDEPSIKAAVCDGVIGKITNAGQDPREYAKRLYIAGKKAKAKLIYRCFSRGKWSEECTDDDITAAFSAMGLSDNKGAMNANLDDIMFGPASSGAATYPGGGAIHQAGGAPHDLATLLFLKRNLIDKLVEVGPEYAGRLVVWIDGQLATLKGCVQDILGINPATFYDDITGALGGLYNRSALVVGDTTSAVSVWINENKAMAFGLTAFVMRYQNNIVGAGRAVGSVLPDIFDALARAGATAGSVITKFWQSDIGVALLLSLYYYDQNAELVNAAAASALKASTGAADSLMASLQQFEQFSSTKIADYAQVKLNDDLVKMMSILEKSLAATDDTAHRAELARILNKTALTQAKLLETVALTRQTRSQTARIAAAKANLTAVQDQLTAETRALIAAELAAKVPGKGGKSHSRKLHKKVSASKRPKKSVHSRKAKGAKRSNKKH
jgi:hypothetical protein